MEVVFSLILRQTSMSALRGVLPEKTSYFFYGKTIRSNTTPTLFNDLKTHDRFISIKSVAIHWGTFILTDEPLTEPPQRLAGVLRAKGIPSEQFLVLKHGETIVMK